MYTVGNAIKNIQSINQIKTNNPNEATA